MAKGEKQVNEAKQIEAFMQLITFRRIIHLQIRSDQGKQMGCACLAGKVVNGFGEVS